MRVWLWSLLLEFALGLACREICRPICATTACLDACVGACSEPQNTPKRRNAEFKIEKLFELPAGERITGGDAPSYPSNLDYYFTTLCGKVYYYVEGSRDQPRVIYQVPDLGTANEKGLYSIAMDRDYGRNNKLYLSYAKPLGTDDPRSHLVQNQNNPNLYTPIIVDHLTVIQEFFRPVDALVPSQILKKLEQYSNESVGNWLGAFAPEFGSFGTGNRLLYATGGNPNEDRLLAMFGSHLSTVRYIVPDNKEVPERQWSSAIQNPIVCSTPNTRISSIRCMVEMHDAQGNVNGTGLYVLKEGTNYGSDDFLEFCGIGLPCKQKYEKALNRRAVLTFPKTQCPVRWVHVYSGWTMRRYYGRVLLVQDSCYNAKTKTFTEAQILYADYNAGLKEPWTTTSLVLEMDNKYLVDAKLLGADSHNTLLLSGISLKTGNTVVQSVKLKPNNHWIFR